MNRNKGATYVGGPGCIMKGGCVVAAGSRADARDQVRLRYNRPVRIDETGL